MAKGVYVGVSDVSTGTISLQTLHYYIGEQLGYTAVNVPTWDATNKKYVFSESSHPVRMGPNNTWYDIWRQSPTYLCAIIDDNPNIFYWLSVDGFNDSSNKGSYEERAGKARKVNKMYIGVQTTNVETVVTTSIPGMFSQAEAKQIGKACQTFTKSERSAEHELVYFIPASSERLNLSFSDWWSGTDSSTGIAYRATYPCFIFQNRYTAIEIIGSSSEISTLEQVAKKITKGYIGSAEDVVNATLSMSGMLEKIGISPENPVVGNIALKKPSYGGSYYEFSDTSSGETEISYFQEWYSWVYGMQFAGFDYSDEPYAIIGSYGSGQQYYYERVLVDVENHEFEFKEYTRGGVARQFWPTSPVVVSQVANLSTARKNLSGTLVTDIQDTTGVNGYLFGGGTSGTDATTAVDAYKSTDFTKINVSALGISTQLLAASSNAQLSFFGGGCANSTAQSRNFVTGYNKALARLNVSSLSVARSQLAGAGINNYVYFVGGMNSAGSANSYVEAYDSTGTKYQFSALSMGAWDISGIDCYYNTYKAGAFVGGRYVGGIVSNISVYVDSTKYTVVATAQTVGTSKPAVASNSNYLIVAGGSTYAGGVVNNAFAYKANTFTQTVLTSLTNASLNTYGGNLGSDYLMFCNEGVCDVYDSTLTKSFVFDIPSIRTNGYMISDKSTGMSLLAGGEISGSTVDTVDKFVLENN